MKWLVLVVFVFGCSGAKESEKTGDETRSGSVPIQPGTTFDDKVAEKDDPVDWKRFEVEEKTPAQISVYWDNPKIKAKIILRDWTAGPVSEVIHQTDAEKDTISTILKDGTYFLEIQALKGASVYTVELILGDPEESSFLNIPRPE